MRTGRAPARVPSPGSPGSPARVLCALGWRSLVLRRALAVDGYARFTKERAPAVRHPRSPHVVLIQRIHATSYLVCGRPFRVQQRHEPVGEHRTPVDEVVTAADFAISDVVTLR